MKSIKIAERDTKVMSPSLHRYYPFVFKAGKGANLWDVEGRKYLDFAASIAVMNMGYNVPEIMNAIKKQLKDGTHCAFPDFYAELPVKYAETLLSFMPVPLNHGKVFLSNSGTESIEAAIKLAKWNKRGKYVIAFNKCFHGRTMGSLSMTNSKPVQRAGFGPFLPVKHVPFPDYYHMNMQPEECSQYCLNELEKTMKLLDGDCSALFIEPVQGEGGYFVPPKSFVKGVRKLCTKYDILLCADEVQSGCWRTGKFLAMENFNVKPDIVSMAKAISGGMPLGATIAASKLMKWPKDSHSNTFGGNLLSCTAGMAALNYMKKKKVGQNAVRVGRFIMSRLDEMKEKYSYIGDVRGLGLMIGVEIVHNRNSKSPAVGERDFILHKSYENGLILLPVGDNSIRICPPLVITKAQANHGLDILEDAFHMLHHKK